MRERFTELTDSEWQFIEKIIANKRQRWHTLRTITNAVLSIVWTGVFEQILDTLVVLERQNQSKESTPSLLAIASQRVKKMTFVSQETGN